MVRKSSFTMEPVDIPIGGYGVHFNSGDYNNPFNRAGQVVSKNFENQSVPTGATLRVTVGVTYEVLLPPPPVPGDGTVHQVTTE